MNPIRRGSRTTRMTSTVRPMALALALAVVPATTLVATTATAHTGTSTSTCAVTWGSLTKSAPGGSTALFTGVRSGRHTCFDRLVIDLHAGTAGYQVRYVPNVYEDGSGALVPLRGGAKLQIIVRAPAYGESGDPTYLPANRRELVDVAGYSTFRQVAWAGSFEGQTTVGLGVRARLPMNVFVLPGPGAGSRLVIDVAHHW